jgi:hypothetical protein
MHQLSQRRKILGTIVGAMLTMAMTYWLRLQSKVLPCCHWTDLCPAALRAVLCAGMHACNTLDSHVYTVVFRWLGPWDHHCSGVLSVHLAVVCAISFLALLMSFLTRTGVRLLDCLVGQDESGQSVPPHFAFV